MLLSAVPVRDPVSMNRIARTDIFSFGCVLYEMLSGCPAFKGEDVSEILAAVLKTDPDWTRLPGKTPGYIRVLLERCLRKDRTRFLQSIGDVRIEMEDAREVLVTKRPKTFRQQLLWMAGTLLLLGIISSIAYYRTTSIPDQSQMRLDVVTPPAADRFSFAVSPDGHQIAFVAPVAGKPRLWVRALDATAAQPLAGTEGASYPFWSPDSRSIGFFAEQKLRRVDLLGGSIQSIADVPVGRGGTWNREGTIVFSGTSNGPLYRVPASGGEVVPVTHDGLFTHFFPQFLPDGRNFLFYVATGAQNVSGIYLASLDSNETKRLTESNAAGEYIAPGMLLWIRQGRLVAQHLDVKNRELKGDIVTVAQTIDVEPLVGRAAFSTSPSGLIAYRAGGLSRRQLVWFDRTGKELGAVGTPDENTLAEPELSPQEDRVAVARSVQGNTDVWLMDIARGVPTRVTFDGSLDHYPVWSPDGNRIVFQSDRNGVYDLYEVSLDQAGRERLLYKTDDTKAPIQWSPDGQLILFHRNNNKTQRRELWLLPYPVEGERKPVPLFPNAEFETRGGRFSPNGRWIAYESNESGQFEVYVRPFPGPGAPVRISTDGGHSPRWRRDGNEVYYIDPNQRMMSVPLTSKAAMVEPSKPVALFQTRIVSGPISRAAYDVASDGRFLVDITTQEAPIPPITLLLNWKAKAGQ